MNPARPTPRMDVHPLTEAGASIVRLRTTKRGWRLSQHGTVLSEVLAAPGPTHSVFDVLAAASRLHPGARDMALLGFGGGGTVAALRALGESATIHAVDLDSTGQRLLVSHGCGWLAPWKWADAEAAEWLAGQRRFDVIFDDLSIPRDGDVVKPVITWETLPRLVPRHLRRGGLAVFNLLRPRGVAWARAVGTVAERFSSVHVVALNEFENRIVLAADEWTLPPAREVHRLLRVALARLGSRQATRFQVRGFR